MIVATMKLIEVGTTKILAGHDGSEETVFVLRRAGDDYELHQVAVSTADQSLRSFLTASDSEQRELVTAILATRDKPKRKRRTKRKVKAK